MGIVESVCERILANAQFVSDYKAIAHQSILTNVGLETSTLMGEEPLRRLVQSAALFAQTKQPDWHQIAYRISVGSLAYTDELGGIAESARLILARLGNYPAIRFAFAEEFEPPTLTPSTFFEITGRRIENTVRVGERPTVLTDMQKAVWDVVTTGASLALSAPTSAGKSYVFLSYIEGLKHKHPDIDVVYLVPSRALIGQVSTELRATPAGQLFGVANVPVIREDSKGSRPIYVLTPERLQVLFNVSPDILFDVAIIDEAHLIGEGSRGIVLHSVLQELQRRKPSVQFLFSSPQVRNPDAFGTIVGNDKVNVIKTRATPVAQNILLLKGDALDSKNIQIFFWEAGQRTLLTKIEVSIPLYNSLDRLIYLSWRLGTGSQSLVYAEGPASCEDIALKIKDLAGNPTTHAPLGEQPLSNEIVEARKRLSNFAKESVHPTYVLADTVLSGVGFHYGRIPALLRHAVEDAFTAGHLNYIVCTSTLLQGVNLPARNIFMQNPHKGPDHPIDPVDFWNLAGRAGRLGRDFQGNVFLVDYDEWKSSPLTGPTDEAIKSALESTLTETPAEFLTYIASDDRPSGESPLLEAAFSKLLRDYRHNRLDETLSRIPALSPEMRSTVEGALENANEQIKVDLETLDASPQISGYRQQQLLEYMLRKIEEKGPDYLIPLHPSASWNEALNKLRPVFARVHKYLELKGGNHHRYWAPLALRWMRGDPLPSIVDSAIRYHQKQGKKRSNRTVIREILTQVESDLRFRYVNLLSCYTGVLRQALQDTKHSDHVAKIPALTLYLELGAASNTMIQLIGFGLSRHTASILAQLTINRDMDAAATLSFLRRLNPEAVGLSPYLSNEVSRVVTSIAAPPTP